MIYRKLRSEDLERYVPDLLKHNDCPALVDQYMLYTPEDVFGTFENDVLIGIISTVDTATVNLYNIENTQVETYTNSVIFGAFILDRYRKQGIFRRLLALALSYTKRHYVCQKLMLLPIAVYRRKLPAVIEMNKNCWVEQPRNNYDKMSLCRPLDYTDISMRSDNKFIGQIAKDLHFSFVGLNAYDNAPIFATQ
ncbi:MAG: hypothetical protein ACRC6V_03940 [Bacteroidales bacterium]